MAAIPYKKTPLAKQGTKWDASKEVKEASVDDLKVMCAWVDDDQNDIKTGYKLPHHKADGKHETVLAGVEAAGNALMGSRGGVKIPAKDLEKVKAHLAKHYHEFGKTAPWEKDDSKNKLINAWKGNK